MKEKHQNFLEPGENFIVVRKLKPEVIEETVKAFVEENAAYWLKLLPISADFDIETLNTVRDEIINKYKYHLED